jgi:hypothetical protein
MEVDEMTTATYQDARARENLREIVDDAAAGRMFGTPIRQGDVVMLPVARLRGCRCDVGTGEAAGRGGAGGSAKALGVFVIRDGKVVWRPAIDVNKAILGAQIVAIVVAFTIRAIVKSRCATARAPRPT